MSLTHSHTSYHEGATTTATAATAKVCKHCGAAVILMMSGNWSTGYPSHLAITCDGTHLHDVDSKELA